MAVFKVISVPQKYADEDAYADLIHYCIRPMKTPGNFIDGFGVLPQLAAEQMLKDYPDVMSIEQMCEILSISTKTGYRILREGKICCLKVGRAYRIPKAHLFTFLCIGCGEAVTA